MYNHIWPALNRSSGTLTGIDKQLHRKSDVLPALSFSLLFHFQGAVAHTTHTNKPPCELSLMLVSHSGAFPLPGAR